MRILILGKNGFIGRNLYEYFSKTEHEVTAVGHRELDLLCEKQVKDFLESTYYDVVLHAAVFNPRTQKESESDKELEYNLRIFYNMEKYSKCYGKMIYFGSGAEFDKREDIVDAGEDDFCNREIPDYTYAFYKYVIQRCIDKSDNIYNFRVFGLFGPYENWKKTFISGACCKAIKGLPITIRKNAVFDYLYIDDFCKIVSSMLEKDLHYHDYNIVSGRKMELLEIAQIVKEISGKDLPIYVCEDGYAKEYSASCERLRNELSDFSCENMRDSIAKLYQWYESKQEQIDLYSLLYQ